ncbi:Uncharacterized protein HZ326_26701 [Fusarium oxysporum f. sp. albedinis]|nr:Uncharacterized protein HZ326_26701 [Fusarium oxysporum f. sp. albedinis]
MYAAAGIPALSTPSHVNPAPTPAPGEIVRLMLTLPREKDSLCIDIRVSQTIMIRLKERYWYWMTISRRSRDSKEGQGKEGADQK